MRSFINSGAPHFDENPCLHLNKNDLQSWQVLIFQNSFSVTKRDIAKGLAKLGCTQDFDFTNHKFDSVKIEPYNFNRKTFIEKCLEDYHIRPFHPGLHQFVDCEKFKLEFFAKIIVRKRLVLKIMK